MRELVLSFGKWAVIDIETTGIDSQRDQIIDLGFLQFDGIKLVKTYSSLVQYEGAISQFIQKLTGITGAMLAKAPSWRETEAILGELEGHLLLAHNAGFESSFLGRYFEAPSGASGASLIEFQDSLLFLGLLFPERSSLGLESFIVDFQIAQQEAHRGLQDAMDLLKVLLVTCGLCLRRREYQIRKKLLLGLQEKYQLGEQRWFFHLLSAKEEDLSAIADGIEFDLWGRVALWAECPGPGGQGQEKEQEQENGATRSGQEVSCNLQFSGDNVKAILRGKLPYQVLSNYSYRREQEELSLRVGQSFKNSVHAMIQAPTGTGKTLGYLLPATLFALEQERKVLVATGTKALQQQIMAKDIPLLKKMLGLLGPGEEGKGQNSLKVCSLVGSQNHLCELLYRQHLNEDLLSMVRPFSERYALIVMDMVFGLNDLLGMEIKRGDIAYVLKKMAPPLLALEKTVAVDFRACIGKKCQYKGSCSYFQGLRQARDADIIVGNHALMFHWPKGFARPAHIVVDEAHKMEGEVSNAFALELAQGDFTRFVQSLGQLQGVGALFYLLSYHRERAQGEQRAGGGQSDQEVTELIRNIREQVKGHAQALGEHLELFREVCERYFKGRPRYTALYWNESPILGVGQLNDELPQAIYNHLQSILFIVRELHQMLSPYAQMYSPQDLEDENALSAFSTFESFWATLDEYDQCLQRVAEDHPKYANSFCYHEEYGFALKSIPIDVGEVVYEQLLQGSESVVFTSATLGNASGNFATQGVAWPLGHTYVPPERRYREGLFLPPIYDYKNCAKVFLCDDVPAMYDRGFVPTILGPVVELIKNLRGRSLLLFSARVRFEVAREVLLEAMGDEFPLFVQGMGNCVVEDYRKSSRGILLGMEAFGEGIDLPGESLQFVFIDKIPDLRQDIITQRRRDFFERTFGREFTDYFLARRARSMAQKLGRLLRREQDVGGAIIVDSRIKRWQGKTTKQFNKLMEPYQIHRSSLRQACDEICQFLGVSNGPKT